MKELLIITILTIYSLNVNAQTNYYVSLTGNNNNPGTLAQPFKTIFKASQVAQPGDNIYVRGGVYQNPDFNDGNIWDGAAAGRITCNGTATGYITFQPYQSEIVTFEFDGNYGVQISNSSYVIFKGFKVKGIAENISQSQAQTNWGLYKLPNNQTVYDITGNENLLPLPAGTTKPSYYNGRGIVANSSHHIKIENNEVYNCPSSGIRVEQSDHTTVVNNKVYQNTYWTTQGVGAITMAESTNVDNDNGYKIIVERNLVYNNENRMISWNPNKSFIKYEIDEGAGIFMTRNEDTYLHGAFKISNNIIYNSGTGGVVCHFTNNAKIVYNSLYYNGTTGAGPQGGIGINTTNNVIIANNIIYARPTKWAIGTLANPNTNTTVANNIVFNEQGVQIHNNISSGWTLVNPLYINPTGFNFNLQSTSQAINNASNTYFEAVDYYNNPRVNGQSDIGAIEFQTSLNVDNFKNSINSITVYPNPNTGILNFINNGEFESVEIYNVNGQLLKSVSIKNKLNNINITNLSDGIYFIKIGKSYTKIIKNSH